MYCSQKKTFNVYNLTKFLNAEQESLCLEEEVVAKHMKEYFKYCGKDSNDKLLFTQTEVSTSYFMYAIQMLNLKTPIAKITPNLNNLYLSILFFNVTHLIINNNL